jgi:hypothetical protein
METLPDSLKRLTITCQTSVASVLLDVISLRKLERLHMIADTNMHPWEGAEGVAASPHLYDLGSFAAGSQGLVRLLLVLLFNSQEDWRALCGKLPG